MRRAFTLIELLVVISIIALLIALLLPVLGSTRDAARLAECQVHMKSLGQAMSMFAHEHDFHMPGTGTNPKFYDANDPAKRSWIGDEAAGGDPDKARAYRTGYRGAIVDYLNSDNALDLYRCPALEEGKVGSGVGSNGMFDYVSMEMFTYAQYDDLPNEVVYFPKKPNELRAPPPLITEENPRFHLNSSNMTPSFGNRDIFGGEWHPNAVNCFVAPDNSVRYNQWPQQVTKRPTCNDVYLQKPSGEWVQMGMAYRSEIAIRNDHYWPKFPREMLTWDQIR